MLVERYYRHAGFFFIGLLAILTWGFYKTYLVFFPSFVGFKTVQHLHGAAMMLWIALLIIQPFLIRMNRPDLHRAIGKSSYVVAPLVVASIFAISKFGFEKLTAANAPEPVRYASLALNVPAIFAFGTFYMLAMVNRKVSSSHLRYMIGTGLLMLGPGLGRAMIMYFNVPFESAVSRVHEATTMIAFVFLIIDWSKKKNITPNLIVFLVLLSTYIIWAIRTGPVWQSVGKGWANIFF